MYYGVKYVSFFLSPIFVIFKLLHKKTGCCFAENLKYDFETNNWLLEIISERKL